MAMKRKIKILLIVVFLIVLIPVLLIFVFPYFDFMYVSADKHWLKGKIADQDDNTGGKSIKKVEQGENVEYFVYKDRLISIEDTDDKVKEICKLPNDIVGVSVKDKDILLYDNNSSIYNIISGIERGKILSTWGDIYLEGRNIYILDDKVNYEKYDLNGKRIFLNKLEYISPFNNIIFDDYVVSVDGHGGLEINVPSYYMFDINKIKYQLPGLKLLRYYLPPAGWNSYREEDILPYDSFAEKVDETARKRISTTDAADRNIDNYNLQSINLYARELLEVSDGYIYILGMQVIKYRDREYKEKLSKISFRELTSEEINEVMYETDEHKIFKIKVDDIKNTSDKSYINYEIIDTSLRDKAIIEGIAIRGKILYLLYNDLLDNEKGDKNLYVFSIDSDTGLYKEIYKKKVFFSEQSDPEIFCTDEHIFIYEYSNDYEKICITRINRDGSNPVLIIDENGEIVMKPL